MQTRGIMALLEVPVGAKRGRRFRKFISAGTHNHRCIVDPLHFRNLPVGTMFLNYESGLHSKGDLVVITLPRADWLTGWRVAGITYHL